MAWNATAPIFSIGSEGTDDAITRGSFGPYPDG
jgi:hypothetical protein